MSLYLTVSPSRFCPYASMTVVPLCITPLPVIIHVPDRMLVIVDGNSRVRGEWVVTPISIDPAHLSTILSSLTSNCSPTRNVRLVRTTPLLKSSIALQCYVRSQLIWICLVCPCVSLLFSNLLIQNFYHGFIGNGLKCINSRKHGKVSMSKANVLQLRQVRKGGLLFLFWAT